MEVTARLGFPPMAGTQLLTDRRVSPSPSLVDSDGTQTQIESRGWLRDTHGTGKRVRRSSQQVGTKYQTLRQLADIKHTEYVVHDHKMDHVLYIDIHGILGLAGNKVRPSIKFEAGKWQYFCALCG